MRDFVDGNLMFDFGLFLATPIAMKLEHLQVMLSKFQNISLDKNLQLQDSNIGKIEAKTLSFNQVGATAIVPVHGPLTYRKTSDFFKWLFGGTSYEEVVEQMEQALSSSKIEKIIFDFNSPGGTVSGLNDAADEIYKARKRKTIIAHVNDLAASAAYGLASACSEVHITRSSCVGSIGTVSARIDATKWDKELGVKWNFIHAGKRKTDFNPHVEMLDEERVVIQKTVDHFNDMFVSMISRNRGISEEEIKKLEAGVCWGEEGIRAKLADSLVSGFSGQSGQTINSKANFKVGFLREDDKPKENVFSQNNKRGREQMTLEELKEKYPELYQQVCEIESVKVAGEAQQRFDAEKAQIQAIMQAKIDSTKNENVEMSKRVMALEEKDVLRSEQDRKSSAGGIWSKALSNSKIPGHLYGDIQTFVQYEAFVKDGIFDQAAFTQTVDAKIKDWEGKGLVATVMGFGTPPRNPDAQYQEKQQDEKDDDTWAEQLAKMVQPVDTE